MDLYFRTITLSNGSVITGEIINYLNAFLTTSYIRLPKNGSNYIQFIHLDNDLIIANGLYLINENHRLQLIDEIKSLGFTINIDLGSYVITEYQSNGILENFILGIKNTLNIINMLTR